MRVYLAATTSGMNREQRNEAIEKGKPKYRLETFFSGEGICTEVLSTTKPEYFLLDSGAFSYMSGAKCDKKMLLEYLKRYIDFINKNDVKYFFELDVDTIFGIEFVEEMRKQLERETGKKCIPVWHKNRGVEYWKKMCQEYDYVAIGGLVFHVKKQEYELIRKMVDYAYKQGVKVHGLGFTKTNELDDYKFYSVDSASWVKAAVLGRQAHFFTGNGIRQRQIVQADKKVKLSALAQHNFVEWCKYQRYMDSKGW